MASKQLSMSLGVSLHERIALLKALHQKNQLDSLSNYQTGCKIKAKSNSMIMSRSYSPLRPVKVNLTYPEGLY